MIKTYFRSKITCWKHSEDAELVVHRYLGWVSDETSYGWTVSHARTGSTILPTDCFFADRQQAVLFAEWAETEADWVTIKEPGPKELGQRLRTKFTQISGRAEKFVS